MALTYRELSSQVLNPPVLLNIFCRRFQDFVPLTLYVIFGLVRLAGR